MGPYFCPRELTEEDVTRAAMRISFSAWTSLEQTSEKEDDTQLLKRYILLCPYVSQDSPVIASVLSALESDGHEHKATAVSKPLVEKRASPPRPPSKIRVVVGTAIRTLLLDSPLVLIFGAYMFLVWVHHVHDNYLKPQMDAAVWNEARALKEMTYYNRRCGVNDLSTTEGHDLFLPENATPEDAYQHQLRHGFTVFPGVLSDETATNLRNFVVSRNRNLTDSEAIFVLSNKHRYSFGLGTEEPSVTKAMMELASNERLKESVEKIMGKNPALIEMTAITATYGATNQEWHDDVIAEGSPVQYGRSFGPSYSIFIQLQNTTKSMGATGACPGTHMCAAGRTDKVCEEYGFQLVNENGFWRTGDALLMNMNSWHRGAAHTDPDAPDRVMLILTFVPKPRSHAESRQLSQGITFSLRWDMWGHTWQDLAHADTAMRQPWATLRALGLYKSPSAEWGVDYVSSACMRMSNGDNGFRQDELEDWVELGGFKFLPDFLEGHSENNDSWHEYLLDTLLRCEAFMKEVSAYSFGGYVLIYLIVSLVFGGPTGGIKGRARPLGWALFRVAVIYGAVFVLYKAALKHVGSTQWAQDISHKLRYTSPFSSEGVLYEGPSTMPHRNDVLIETRYKSEYLAMYNDYVGNHPGNRLWNELVNEKAPTHASYSGLPSVFREALAEYIVGAVRNSPGRFLAQKYSGWVEMSSEDAIIHTSFELAVRSNSILKKVVQQLDFLISEAKYGHLRGSAMSQWDILPYLNELRQRLVYDKPRSKQPMTAAKVEKGKGTQSLKLRHNVFSRTFLLSKPEANRSSVRRPVVIHVGQLPGEPEKNAWLRAGDIVSTWYNEDGATYWYKSKLLQMLNPNYCTILYLGYDEVQKVRLRDVTRYIPPKLGDVVEVSIEGDDFYEGIILRDKGGGFYDVDIDGEVHEDLTDISFRQI